MLILGIGISIASLWSSTPDTTGMVSEMSGSGRGSGEEAKLLSSDVPISSSDWLVEPP